MVCCMSRISNVRDMNKWTSIVSIKFPASRYFYGIEQRNLKVFVCGQRISMDSKSCVWWRHYHCVPGSLLGATSSIFTVDLLSRWDGKKLGLCSVLGRVLGLSNAFHIHVILWNLHVFSHVFGSIGNLELIISLAKRVFNLQLSLHVSNLELRDLLMVVRTINHGFFLIFYWCASFELKLVFIFGRDPMDLLYHAW